MREVIEAGCHERKLALHDDMGSEDIDNVSDEPRKKVQDPPSNFFNIYATCTNCFGHGSSPWTECSLGVAERCDSQITEDEGWLAIYAVGFFYPRTEDGMQRGAVASKPVDLQVMG